jgi:hypothetical protein
VANWRETACVGVHCAVNRNRGQCVCVCVRVQLQSDLLHPSPRVDAPDEAGRACSSVCAVIRQRGRAAGGSWGDTVILTEMAAMTARVVCKSLGKGSQ